MIVQTLHVVKIDFPIYIAVWDLSIMDIVISV